MVLCVGGVYGHVIRGFVGGFLNYVSTGREVRSAGRSDGCGFGIFLVWIEHGLGDGEREFGLGICVSFMGGDVIRWEGRYGGGLFGGGG